MEFSRAVVRKPAPDMVRGLTGAGLGLPDYELALEQHGKYVEALISCGLEVMTLGPDSRFPDSTFVEDTAVLCQSFGLVSRPGAVTRRGEILEIDTALHRFYKKMEHIKSPGTLEGGDVMLVGNRFYVGISERTNEEGADQLIKIAEKHKMSGAKVPLKKFLHLKSGVSYLENNTLLVSGEIKRSPAFADFDKISIPGKEAYAANSLWVNGRVLVASGFPKTQKLIENAGYETIVLDMSEFRKLDGGLSCLSLRL